MLDRKILIKRKPSLYKKTILKSFINTIKGSKEYDFSRFFQGNTEHLKTTWKGIKKIIYFNDTNHTFPSSIKASNETITNPFDI